MIYTIFSNALMALLVCLTTAIASLPRAHSPYVIKESHPVPRRWERVGPAPAQHLVQLQIGLKQNNFKELERLLYEVSDPAHHRYGQHLSAAYVNELVKPSHDTLKLVHDWLLDHNITADTLRYSPAKDWIKVTLSIESVERLLDTDYSLFEHEDGSQIVRAPEWSLPLHLHEHVETIQPTNSFFRARPKRSTLKVSSFDEEFNQEQAASLLTGADPTVAEACNVTAVTPLCLRKLYGTLDYTVQKNGTNQIGLTNYLGEANNRSDVSIFLGMFRPEAVSAAYNFTVQTIAGGNDQQTPNNSTQLASGKDTEGNLDAETILGITWPTPLTTYNTGGNPDYIQDDLTLSDTNEPYLTWLQYILNQTNIPQVISTSYGDDEQTVPYSYATSVCNGFAQLGARGVTLLFATGDNGVGPADDCFTNDGKNTTTFLPEFPASCPYVTSVGATRNVSPEIVAHDPKNNFTGGGGFSNYFARPSYQDAAVSAYLRGLGSEFTGLYNTSGRGYPDIAAQGYHFITIWNGTIFPLDGTSAATPTAASVISLVNDALLAAGKPVLGFLNPWLYSNAGKGFTDITEGSSIGCNTTGFPAGPGWDAASGFGTPYFPQIQAAVIGGGISVYANIYMMTSAIIFVVAMMSG